MPAELNYDLPFDQYLALPAVSKSYLWNLTKCPAAAQVETPDKPEYAIGRASHCYILEGTEVFDAHFAVAPKVDRRTKDGKAEWERFLELAGDKETISFDDYDAIIGMSESVHSHPMAGHILAAGGWPEVSAVWHDEETGMRCKARADLLTPQGVIIDLKTCRDAGYGFQRDVASFGYHVQAASYLSAFAAKADSFVFIAVEKAPPYRCECYVLDDEYLSAGYEKYRELLALEKQCRMDGYPNYTHPGIQTIAKPAYL